MKRSPRMTIQQATADYESWLAGQLTIVPEDLALKHQRMRAAIFPFLRATYYRWAQLFPQLCKELCRAPQVLAVGDLHVENFGTWRDAEGRLVWGINDFDEAWRLPYAHDLVRLATSAHLALEDGHLAISRKEACESILAGYKEGLESTGRAFVLAEHSKALREMATARLADPQQYWEKLTGLPPWKGEVPEKAARALIDLLPRPDLAHRVSHRVAGLGSLGRQRFVAIADWAGGKIAREAKALASSAAVWAFGGEDRTKLLYQTILDESVRSIDPWVKVRRRWIVRRLAPDCSRIELTDLPKEQEESRLLRAMGWETANVHLGSRTAHALLVDLAARESEWLHEAAKTMLEAVREDWEAWRKQPAEPVVRIVKAAAGGTDGPGSAPAGVGAEDGSGVGPPEAAAAPAESGRSRKAVAVAAKPKAAGKAERSERPEKPGKPGKPEKRENPEKPESTGKAVKARKPGKAGKPAKAGKVAKAGKLAKAGKAPKTGKAPEKAPKAAAAGKAAHADKVAKAGHVAKSGKAPSKPAKAAKPGKAAQAGNAGESR
jgi:hypothetical protein